MRIGYIEQLDEIKAYDPDLYRIARQRRFGVNGIIVLPQFEVQHHEDVMQVVHGIPGNYKRVGFDFGFEKSY